MENPNHPKCIFSEKGLEGVARFIHGLQKDEGVSYHTALGRYMISSDLFLSDNDTSAIYETYKRLFPLEA